MWAKSVYVQHQHSPVTVLCLVTSSVTSQIRHQLEQQHCRVQEVESIANPHNSNPRFADTFTKLNAWQLSEFHRVLLMDADTIVLKPLDALFHTDLSNADVAAVGDW